MTRTRTVGIVLAGGSPMLAWSIELLADGRERAALWAFVGCLILISPLIFIRQRTGFRAASATMALLALAGTVVSVGYLAPVLLPPVLVLGLPALSRKFALRQEAEGDDVVATGVQSDVGRD